MSSIDIYQNQTNPNQTNANPCPFCSSLAVEKLKWVWWGGAVGAKLFKQAKCQHCLQKFNFQTGQKIPLAFILLYNLVMLLLFVVFFCFLFFYLRTLTS